MTTTMTKDGEDKDDQQTFLLTQSEPQNLNSDDEENDDNNNRLLTQEAEDDDDEEENDDHRSFNTQEQQCTNHKNLENETSQQSQTSLFNFQMENTMRSSWLQKQQQQPSSPSTVASKASNNNNNNNHNNKDAMMLLTQDPAAPSDADSVSTTSSSSSSSDSEEEEIDPEEQKRKFLAKVVEKRRQNEELLRSLGLVGNTPKKKNMKESKQSNTPEDAAAQENDDSPQGMLLLQRRTMSLQQQQQQQQPTEQYLKNDTNNNNSSSTSTSDLWLQSIEAQFPGRQVQIQKLSSLLSLSVARFAVPPPVFVTGAAGTGKSALLQSLVQHIIVTDQNTTTRIPPPPPTRTRTTTDQTPIKPHSNLNNCFLHATSTPAPSSQSNNNSDNNNNNNNNNNDNDICKIQAYINCATLDNPTIDNLTQSIYRQFEQQLRTMALNRSSGSSRKRNSSRYSSRRKRKRTHKLIKGMTPNSEKNKIPRNDVVTTREVVVSDLVSKQASAVVAKTNLIGKIVESSNKNDNQDDDDDDDLKHLEELEDRMERKQSNRRSVRGRGTTSKQNNNATTTTTAADPANPATTTLATTGGVVSNKMTPAALTSVWKLGRSLEMLFADYDHEGNSSSSSKCAAILILDHADQLLSVDRSRAKNANFSVHTNYLSQLLLLPQTIGLNLGIYVVSNSILLNHTGLNNFCSLGTIGGHIQPIRVHFPAYHGKQILKRILSTPHVQSLIIGEDQQSQCAAATKRLSLQRTYYSFVDTMIQTMQDCTTDIKEYIRLGRSLWPKYIEPLSSSNIKRTIETIRKTKSANAPMDLNGMQREILHLLDRRIYPTFRNSLENSLFALSLDSPFVVGDHSATLAPTESVGKGSDVKTLQARKPHDLPILCKYLVLAAFLCQVNRADKDRQLFSVQKNGKKRRGRNGKADGSGEDVAYGKSAQGDAQYSQQQQQQNQVKSFRPRIFPLERLRSVYVSMVGLNASVVSRYYLFAKRGLAENDEEMIRSLGTNSFNESLAHLRDIGLLNESQEGGALKLSNVNYWCSLTRSEAQEIAKSIDFPIDRYTLT